MTMSAKARIWNDRKSVLAVVEFEKVAKISALRAIRRSMKWAATRVIREVASNLSISPQSLVRKRVKASARARPGGKVHGFVSVLVNEIPVARLAGVVDSGVQQGMMRTGSGVRVPRHGSFPNAFIAQGLGGNRMVFERKGKSRLPLKSIKIAIRPAALAAVTTWVAASVPIAQAEIRRQLALRKVSASDVDTTIGVDGA